MRQRPIMKFRPGVERVEERHLLSTVALTTHVANLKEGARAFDRHSAAKTDDVAAVSKSASHHSGLPVRADRARQPSRDNSFLAFRVTNTPYQLPYKLVPPFQQVLVQSAQPVPGTVYNVLYIAVKNGTSRTFDASSDFAIRVSGQHHSSPILTGAEQWKPGQVIVFYVLTKKYYPMSFVPGGFQLDLGGAASTLIPGPSGIFLRLKYNPARFARTLDWIVAFGQGAQLGKGPKLGLPDTAINEFVSAKTHRLDFGGRF
jgi:hypothetical protein